MGYRGVSVVQEGGKVGNEGGKKVGGKQQPLKFGTGHSGAKGGAAAVASNVSSYKEVCRC